MPRKATLVVLATLAVAASGALDAGAEERKRYKTRVAISYQRAEPTDVIAGKVRSKRERECVKGRTANLIVDGTPHSQDTTNRRGRFSIQIPFDPPRPNVEYVVEVRRKPILNRGNPRPPLVCKRGLSNTVVGLGPA